MTHSYSVVDRNDVWERVCIQINCKHRAACVAIIRGRTLIGGKKEWIERPLEKCEKRLFGR